MALATLLLLLAALPIGFVQSQTSSHYATGRQVFNSGVNRRPHHQMYRVEELVAEHECFCRPLSSPHHSVHHAVAAESLASDHVKSKAAEGSEQLEEQAETYLVHEEQGYSDANVSDSDVSSEEIVDKSEDPVENEETELESAPETNSDNSESGASYENSAQPNGDEATQSSAEGEKVQSEKASHAESGNVKTETSDEYVESDGDVEPVTFRPFEFFYSHSRREYPHSHVETLNFDNGDGSGSYGHESPFNNFLRQVRHRRKEQIEETEE